MRHCIAICSVVALCLFFSLKTTPATPAPNSSRPARSVGNQGQGHGNHGRGEEHKEHGRGHNKKESARVGSLFTTGKSSATISANTRQTSLPGWSSTEAICRPD